MRRFGFLLVTVAGLTVVGVLLLYNGRLRGSTTLRDPKTPLFAANRRIECFRVRLVSSDPDLARVATTPVIVRLRPDSAHAWAGRIWYAGDFVPADSSAPLVHWAPYPGDSLDVNIETFPIAVHVRFSTGGGDSAARLEHWDDTGAITRPGTPAFVARVGCR
jgi:hypothetical protein